MSKDEIIEWIAKTYPESGLAYTYERDGSVKPDEYQGYGGGEWGAIMYTFFADALSVCDCGSPETVAIYIRDLLDRVSKAAHTDDMEIHENIIQDPKDEFALHILDRNGIELITHHSSIYTPALTEKGERWLEILNTWADEVDEEDW